MGWLIPSLLSSFYQTQENLGSNGALCPLSDGAGSLFQLFHFHWCVCVCVCVCVRERERELCCSVTHCDLMDYSLPGSSVYGIFQARILGWVAVSYSRGSSRPKGWNQIYCVSCIGSCILCETYISLRRRLKPSEAFAQNHLSESLWLEVSWFMGL